MSPEASLLIGAALGALVGAMVMRDISVGSGDSRSEWERWFRYYLDAMGSGSMERAASFADATMEEIAKRRKG